MKYAVLDSFDVASREAIDLWLDRASTFPRELTRRVHELGDALVRAKPPGDPDSFSALEQVWHLRDVEIGGYALRFRAVVRREHPFLPDIDGTRLAHERCYAQRDLERGLRELARARASNVAFLRGLGAAEFACSGELEGVGCVTLARLVANWRAHDDGHIEEFDALRRRLAR